MNERGSTIVLGVVPGQPAEVLEQAAELALALDAQLICATVDDSRYTIARQADGTIRSLPIDPDLVEDEAGGFDADLYAHLASVLQDRGVRWSVRALAGGAATELAWLADVLGARMIVVGTRAGGWRGSARELFNGSVAAQLAHQQHRPVMVIPRRTGDVQ
ncbi:universal stress protein [Glutamicibacter endophyticus]|uniref:universal stress protein n=1 Tax=Glutamicibacter endophyticus TaxID=1522174 RepID=UPI003AF00F9B